MPNDAKPQVGDKYIVRFPPGLRDKLHALAARHDRSLNSELVAIAEEAVDAGGKVAALQRQLAEASETSHSLRTAAIGSNMLLTGMGRELLKLSAQVAQDQITPETRYMVQFAQAMLNKDGEAMYDLFIQGFARTPAERKQMEADKAELIEFGRTGRLPNDKTQPREELEIPAFIREVSPEGEPLQIDVVVRGKPMTLKVTASGDVEASPRTVAKKDRSGASKPAQPKPHSKRK